MWKTVLDILNSKKLYTLEKNQENCFQLDFFIFSKPISNLKKNSKFYFSFQKNSNSFQKINLIIHNCMHCNWYIFLAIQCNGEDSCYPLAFGIPAALMVLATVSFMSGSIAYKKYPPKENVMSRVVFTIGVWFQPLSNVFFTSNKWRGLLFQRALKNKWGSKVERDHWLEHYLDTHVCDEDPKCLALNSNGKINVNKCAQVWLLLIHKNLLITNCSILN